MGNVCTETKPPLKTSFSACLHRICSNLYEVDVAKLQRGELVYCVQDGSVFVFDEGRLNKLSTQPEVSCQQAYIRCEYCDSELENKYINCPNCGAPLRRNNGNY